MANSNYSNIECLENTLHEVADRFNESNTWFQKNVQKLNYILYNVKFTDEFDTKTLICAFFDRINQLEKLNNNLTDMFIKVKIAKNNGSANYKKNAISFVVSDVVSDEDNKVDKVSDKVDKVSDKDKKDNDKADKDTTIKPEDSENNEDIEDSEDDSEDSEDSEAESENNEYQRVFKAKTPYEKPYEKPGTLKINDKRDCLNYFTISHVNYTTDSLTLHKKQFLPFIKLKVPPKLIDRYLYFYDIKYDNFFENQSIHLPLYVNSYKKINEFGLYEIDTGVALKQFTSDIGFIKPNLNYTDGPPYMDIFYDFSINNTHSSSYPSFYTSCSPSSYPSKTIKLYVRMPTNPNFFEDNKNIISELDMICCIVFIQKPLKKQTS